MCTFKSRPWQTKFVKTSFWNMYIYLGVPWCKICVYVCQCLCLQIKHRKWMPSTWGYHPHEWPAFSLALNPIEHVWGMLGRRFEVGNHLLHAYRNFGELCLLNGVIFLTIRLPIHIIIWWYSTSGVVHILLHYLGATQCINHHTNHVMLSFCSGRIFCNCSFEQKS